MDLPLEIEAQSAVIDVRLVIELGVKGVQAPGVLALRIIARTSQFVEPLDWMMKDSPGAKPKAEFPPMVCPVKALNVRELEEPESLQIANICPVTVVESIAVNIAAPEFFEIRLKSVVAKVAVDPVMTLVWRVGW